MAFPHSAWPGLVLPVIDARKHRYFTALYQGAERISAYMDADTGEIRTRIRSAPRTGPVLLTGPDADTLALSLAELGGGPEDFFVDPAHKRGWGRELLAIAKTVEINDNEMAMGPLYLRQSDAELNLRKR
jgi:tRNA threonylcarbamoyladenosine biosynthesis protein TsaB